MLFGTAAAVLFHGRERILTIVRPDRVRTRAATSSIEENKSAPVDSPGALERLTRAELYRRAQAAGIPGRAAMSKAELIAALLAR
jgi:hypothetical protein